MKSTPFLLPSLLVIGFVGIPCLSSEAQTTGVPGFISYQGHVLDSTGEVVAKDSAVNRTVIFRIWNDVSAIGQNNLIYSEEQTVTIADGEFSVLVGQGVATAVEKYGYSETAKGPPDTKIADAFNWTERFLGVTIDDGDAGTVDNEISPRQRIVSSAYAFRAKYAETLGTAQNTALTVLDNGRIGVGTAAPTHPLQVTGGIASRSATANDGYVTMNPGSAANAGYVGWFNPGGVRIAYMGYETTDLRLNLEAGKNFVVSGGETHIHGNLYSGAHHIMGNRGSHGQGVHLEWNKDGGGGKTYLLNQRGGGGGGMVFGEVDTANGITERMVIHPNGWLDAKVGFVTGGSVVVDGANANNNLIFGNGSLESIGSRRTPGTNQYGLDFITLGQPRLSITNSGNVGIGTSSPGTRLDVSGIIRAFGANAGVAVGSSDAVQRAILGVADGAGAYSTSAAKNDAILRSDSGKLLLQSGSGAAAIAIATSNSVGIGTTTPVAKLDVRGSGAGIGVETFSYFDANFNNTPIQRNTVGSWGYSIFADGRIGASGFHARSDARIKKIVGQSDAAKDLKTLTNIQVTDFQYKDVVAMGGVEQKKVIAQQVEKVFPQAVSRMVGVVPDIYKSAAVEEKGWIRLATDLKKGERVRLLGLNHDEVHEVLEVKEDSFRTDYSPEESTNREPGSKAAENASTDKTSEKKRVPVPKKVEREKAATAEEAEFAGKVFVYGREVDDLRLVDYEAIAMLNVSATQELKKEKDVEVKALQEENAELRRRLALSEERLSELAAAEKARDARLTAIESLLRASGGKSGASTISLK